MVELYSDKFIKKNGAIASKLWSEALNTLTDEQIKKGIFKCKERIFEGNAWAPDLSEFLALIHGQTAKDFQSAFFRLLDKKPDGRIERWVYEKASFNIRAMSHENAEKAHKRFMLEAIELDRAGKLTLNEDEILLLPVHSVKNLNDIKREEYESKGKTHKFADKLKKMKEDKIKNWGN